MRGGVPHLDGGRVVGQGGGGGGGGAGVSPVNRERGGAVPGEVHSESGGVSKWESSNGAHLCTETRHDCY